MSFVSYLKRIILLATFVFSASILAQVRLVQWSDAHSSLETLPEQLTAIDKLAKEYKKTTPGGE
ncbi:MAG: hypothetical protein KDD34_09640, partial [Bdellovibrionales bacterium]|nr:hypothetical protein [Bdellovibrionales bacterium]